MKQSNQKKKNKCQRCGNPDQPKSRLFRNRENIWCCEDCYNDTTAVEYNIKLLKGNEIWRIPNSKRVR